MKCYVFSTHLTVSHDPECTGSEWLALQNHLLNHLPSHVSNTHSRLAGMWFFRNWTLKWELVVGYSCNSAGIDCKITLSVIKLNLGDLTRVEFGVQCLITYLCYCRRVNKLFDTLLLHFEMQVFIVEGILQQYSGNSFRVQQLFSQLMGSFALWGIWHPQEGIPGTELDKKVLFFFLGAQKQNDLKRNTHTHTHKLLLWKWCIYILTEIRLILVKCSCTS